MSNQQFVILHHKGYGAEHWDLMLQQGQSLATWRLENQPTGRPHETIAARRIGDQESFDTEGTWISQDIREAY